MYIITFYSQEECWWDCTVHTLFPKSQTLTLGKANAMNTQAITNLECLDDCFLSVRAKRRDKKREKGKRGHKTRSKGKREDGGRMERMEEDTTRSDFEIESDPMCISYLLKDVKEKGTCGHISNFATIYKYWYPNATELGSWGVNSTTANEECKYSGNYIDLDWVEVLTESTVDLLSNENTNQLAEINTNYVSMVAGFIHALLYSDTGGTPPLYTEIVNTPVKATKGTCSAKTLDLLNTISCQKAIAEQPTAIRNTIVSLLQAACDWDTAVEVIKSFLVFEDQYFSQRIAPVAHVDVIKGTKTELNFTNTRHRYPWICSLRKKGIGAEHLCAVTILSVPPKPSIIVGAAHCTYLCKDGGPNGAFLESCCCTPGKLGCSEDIVRCGTNPGAAEMDPDEVIILCGEWQTGPSPRRFTGEEYNVPLRVKEIIKHPGFNPAVGVDAGNDLAVFKIDEEGLKESQAKGDEINPICLPYPNRENAVKGVHSGWGNPPPLYYYDAFGQGFLPFAIDSLKQWHYDMDIYPDCRDEPDNGLGHFGPWLHAYHNQSYLEEAEKNIATLGLLSKAVYPPGLICAREAASQFCPTPGDSGSPLMVKRKDNRYDSLIISTGSCLKIFIPGTTLRELSAS